jgi:hypothetical protein
MPAFEYVDHKPSLLQPLSFDLDPMVPLSLSRRLTPPHEAVAENSTSVRQSRQLLFVDVVLPGGNNLSH